MAQQVEHHAQPSGRHGCASPDPQPPEARQGLRQPGAGRFVITLGQLQVAAAKAAPGFDPRIAGQQAGVQRRQQEPTCGGVVASRASDVSQAVQRQRDRWTISCLAGQPEGFLVLLARRRAVVVTEGQGSRSE
jgi:hypothetical protein